MELAGSLYNTSHANILLLPYCMSTGSHKLCRHVHTCRLGVIRRTLPYTPFQNVSSFLKTCFKKWLPRSQSTHLEPSGWQEKHFQRSGDSHQLWHAGTHYTECLCIHRELQGGVPSPYGTRIKSASSKAFAASLEVRISKHEGISG